jgi:hypothetical protein
VCASPKRECNQHRIDLEAGPPCPFVTLPVELAMMQAAYRNRELIADFAPQRSRLHKAKMVRIGRLAAAHDAGLLGHELEVVLVARIH